MLSLLVVKFGLWLIGIFLIVLWVRFVRELNSIGNRVGFVSGGSLVSTVYSAFFRGASSHVLRAITLTSAATAAYAFFMLLVTFSFEKALNVFAEISPSIWTFFTIILLFSPLGKQGLTQMLSPRLSVSYDRKKVFGCERVIAFHLVDPDFKLTTKNINSVMQEVAATALGIRNAGFNGDFRVRSWLLAPAKSKKNKETKKFQKTLKLPECLMKLHSSVNTSDNIGWCYKSRSIFASLVCIFYLLGIRSIRIKRARDKTPVPTDPLLGVGKALLTVQENFPTTKLSTLPIKKISVFDAIHIVAHKPGEWRKINAWTAGFEFS